MVVLDLIFLSLLNIPVTRSDTNVTLGHDPLLTHHTVLDKDDKVHLSWRPDHDGITFRYTVATHGYIGLGFSPGGGMHGADIVLGWVDTNGQVHLTDRHAVGNNVPYLDTSQDYSLDWGYENETHTVIQFHRVWDTCDDQDLILGHDTVRLIWAFSEDDPMDSTHLLYHSLTQRGSRSIYLSEPASSTSPLPDHKLWDLRADNLLLPESDHTHYWCKIYRAPDLDRKHHMIAIEPLIQSGHESYVHHMVLYECHIPGDLMKEAEGATSADWFQRHVNQPGEACYSPNMPAEWSFCLATNAWAWAVGSDGETLPEHTGMPLGEKYGGATYFMLETHYDNPAYHAPLIDNSGIRIRYTEHLRQYDTGMMLLGSEVNFLQFIPPHQASFISTGHCTAQCTQEGLPETGIKIISGVLHSHLAGRKMRLRHIRNGIELPVILEDNHYDFNFQASRVPRSETIVYPGDELLLECDYETKARDAPTFGGLSTRDEMCLVFVLYYPRSSLADCRSLPALHTLTQALGIHQIYGHSFEKLVDFMKDIGSLAATNDKAETGADSSDSSLKSLLKILAEETGQSLMPRIQKRPSVAPLTEEELLNLPFYSVATQEPEVEQNLANYRTLLIEMLMKIRIKSPSSLHNKTIGEIFVEMDWEERGREMNSMLLAGEHNSLCLAHGRKPIIPYQTFSPASFKQLDRERVTCNGVRQHLPANPSYHDLFSVAPLRSSSTLICLSKLSLLILCLPFVKQFS